MLLYWEKGRCKEDKRDAWDAVCEIDTLTARYNNSQMRFDRIQKIVCWAAAFGFTQSMDLARALMRRRPPGLRDLDAWLDSEVPAADR